jgi:peptide/nickel transport system permease protein
MINFVIKRIVWSVPVMFVASVIVFAAIKATTDPTAIRSPGIRAEDMVRYREQLGLDEPAHRQYFKWLGNFVQGDLGESLRTRRPVAPELLTAMGNTLQLGVFAFALALLCGVAIGTLSAVKQYSLFDNLATGASFFGLSIPPFFFGLILQIVFVLQWSDWFGSSPLFTSRMNSPGVDGFGWDRLMHMLLPALTVAVQSMAIYSRFMRAALLETLSSDYMRTARAKGLSERRVVLRHALRNALAPLTMMAALDVGAIIGGLVITERIFEWPGMGMYFLDAMSDGDYVRVLPWMMIVVGGAIAVNLVADLLLGVLDPRVRRG